MPELDDNWIEVTPDLPEEGVEVLLYGDKYGVIIGKRDWRQGHNPDFWDTSEGNLDIDEITHYQPKPLPPKKK